MSNTALIYLYRDAVNYKEWGRAVFEGAPRDGLEDRLRASLLEGEWFIAHEVDLPSVYPYEPGSPSVDDHIRHEFYGVEPTDEAQTDPRSFRQVVATFEAAEWDEPAETERVGMVW